MILAFGLMISACQKEDLNADFGMKPASGSLSYPRTVCLGDMADFTFTATGNVQIQLLVEDQYVQIFQEAKSTGETFYYSFTEVGTYHLRHHIGNKWTYFTIEVIECGDCIIRTEGAFAGNTSVDANPWFYYFNAEVSEQDVHAGKKGEKIGTASLDEGTLTIVLIEGWELIAGDETVKIEGFKDIPTSSTARGHFSKKGNSLVISDIDAANYYIIHLDVQICE